MKYLISLFFACLFIVSCTCDEPICPTVEELSININYSEDFTLSELRRSNLVILDTVNQVNIDSFNLISQRSTSRNTTIHFYDYYYYYNLPSMDNIYILNFDNFSDTIRSLYYETNETTYRCNRGCNIPDYSTVTLTELNNFYMIHQGDTIHEKTVFIEK